MRQPMGPATPMMSRKEAEAMMNGVKKVGRGIKKVGGKIKGGAKKVARKFKSYIGGKKY